MVADAFSAVSRAYCSPFFLASQLNSTSRGAHAGEGVGHEGDEGPVTLSDKDSGVDAIQQLASLFPESVLPFLTEYFGPRTDAAGFISMACPTTTQSNSARMAARCCFYCRLRCRDEAVLNMSGDVHGSDGRKIVDDAHLTPARKLRDRMVVRLARIPVSDVDGEEFPEPFRRPRVWRENGGDCATCGTVLEHVNATLRCIKDIMIPGPCQKYS